MKASRADGCVKIKVVGVSGRTHGRKASFDEEKESVKRKERESTCVMETEGYGDSDQNEIILDGKDNKIKEDEKSVMENKMEQVPIMENISVMEKEGDEKPIMENQTVMEKGGHQDTVMENQSVTEKGEHQDTVMENQSVMEKEGDQTTIMENQNVMKSLFLVVLMPVVLYLMHQLRIMKQKIQCHLHQ